MMAIAFAVSGLAAPSMANALEVQIYPDQPQLGDTISVQIQADPGSAAPIVMMNQQPYPAFAMGGDRFRALLPTTPMDVPGQVTIQVQDEDETRNLALWLGDRNFPTQSIWVPEGQLSLGTDFEFDRVDEFKTLVSPERFWTGVFLRPTDGYVSTIYGVQRYYNGVFAEDYYHRGVDYAAASGTPIVAPADGRIALVGYESQGFELHGNTIGIDHGQGVLSIFLHLSRIDVQEGDVVRAGQPIGAVGSTGISTGPHLHWGLYVHGMAVDPVPWRYDGIE